MCNLMEQERDPGHDGIIAIIRRHADLEGPLLPILHAIQAEYGWVSEATIRLVAQELNLSRAEVHGVVSFYHDFRTRAEHRPVIRLCRAEACQARGSEPLAEQAMKIAGDRVAIEPVYCLGLCSVGPNAAIGGTVHARLDKDRLRVLIETV